MTQIRDNARAPSDRGGRGRIRAIRFTDDRKECERRLKAFGLFARTFEQDSDTKFALRVARALRAERRAAHLADDNYDPLRHLVLTRLDRRLRHRRNSAKPACCRAACDFLVSVADHTPLAPSCAGDLLPR